MICWLLQSSSDLPVDGEGDREVSYLARQEREQYAALKTEKRRHDWLLGRWTAKKLVQAIVWEECGRPLKLDEILIGRGMDGAPFVSCNSDSVLPNYDLSISHSGDLAFCATVRRRSPAETDACLGADIERVEARPAGFVREYFTEEEAALVEHFPVDGRAGLVTTLWSAKEAALKAIRQGLRLDTRSLTCLVEPRRDSSQTWIPFSIHWDQSKLARGGVDIEAVPTLSGWWREVDGYVLTLASNQNDMPRDDPICNVLCTSKSPHTTH
jgi:4'-phosphopantetheinyl transferase